MRAVRKSLDVYAVLAAVCFVIPFSVLGQSATQRHGTVVDQSGGNISGATVTLFFDDRVRTAKTDDHGSFVFSGSPGPARYIEASATGFASVSIPLGDKSSDELLITLAVGGCSGPCLTVVTLSERFVNYEETKRSVNYQERSGPEQLSGTVGEYLGSPLVWASLVLRKADLDGPQAAQSFANRNLSMLQRNFQYSDAAETVSDENGKFHFAGLEPGWYSLEVNYADYPKETRNFWIARETLTQPSPIEMLRPGGPSPQPIGEASMPPAPR